MDINPRLVGAYNSDPFLRVPDVCRLTGFSRASIYRLEASGEFPPRLKIGAGAVAWRLSDVERWMSSRPEASAL